MLDHRSVPAIAWHEEAVKAARRGDYDLARPYVRLRDEAHAHQMRNAHPLVKSQPPPWMLPPSPKKKRKKKAKAEPVSAAMKGKGLAQALRVMEKRTGIKVTAHPALRSRARTTPGAGHKPPGPSLVEP